MKMLQIINKRIDELNENYNEIYNYWMDAKNLISSRGYKEELQDIKMLIDELLDLKQEYLQEAHEDETNN